MKYKLTYRLYTYDLSVSEDHTVVTEDPFMYMERIRADLMMCRPDMQVGTYTIEKIRHLEVVK